MKEHSSEIAQSVQRPSIIHFMRSVQYQTEKLQKAKRSSFCTQHSNL